MYYVIFVFKDNKREFKNTMPYHKVIMFETVCYKICVVVAI